MGSNLRETNVGDQEAAYAPVAFHENRKTIENGDNYKKYQTCPGQVRLKRAAEQDVLATNTLDVQRRAEARGCVTDRYPGE
jgi:hypothetical protein